MVKLPSKNLERKFFDKGYKKIIAMDEVGLGCLAGPLVVGAVSIDKKIFSRNARRRELLWLRDSKLLNPEQREKYFEYLTTCPEIDWKVTFVQPKTIDKLNIFHATHLGMKNSLKKFTFTPDVILIDGRQKIKGTDVEQLSIIKGDQKVFSIACASLIAKVARDRYMKKISKKYPGYDFDRHKGYATKLHQSKIKKLGLSDIHRKSFDLDQFL